MTPVDNGGAQRIPSYRAQKCWRGHRSSLGDTDGDPRTR